MNTQYIDITWLTTFGLSTENVLDYFYTSPFYDSKSNNEIIRTQGVSTTHLQQLVGLEYCVDITSCKEPHLYVIRKQLRRSKGNTETLDIFYCLDGIIYQSPVLLDVLNSRIAKAAHHLRNSFEQLAGVANGESEDPQAEVDEFMATN